MVPLSCGQIKDPEHLSFFAKHYLQLPHEMYFNFNSDRNMAKDIDITAAATFFQDNSLHHIKIPSGMFNVHVRSFSVPTHGQTVALLVQMEDGDTDLYVNCRIRCVILRIVTGIVR